MGNADKLRLGTIWIVLLGLGASAGALRAQDPVQEGNRAFTQGEFASARRQYLRIGPADAGYADAVLKLGEIELLRNRLEAAAGLLNKAAGLAPGNARAKKLLAEVYYRQLDFAKAAALLRETGEEAKAVALESLAGRAPYELAGDFREEHVKFVQTDPLPLVQVRINGHEPVFFLIDTGAAEIILDDGYAREAGVKSAGGAEGTFAGGKRGKFAYGTADSIALGGLKVGNVPVMLQSTQAYAPVADGRRVDGIIGTVFLYQFLATLDYPGGELALRRKIPGAREATAKGAKAMPFWLAGDHYIVSWGRINTAESRTLLLVDTGLAGMGITAPKDTLEAAKVSLTGRTEEGVGGGGAVQAIPIVAERVWLGDVEEDNIHGVYGVFPATLENGQGFRIGGLISHEFFGSYALTLDFERMELRLRKGA